MGPQKSPTCATPQEVKGGPPYAYRICRKGENPWRLRNPQTKLLDTLSFAEQRVRMLTAVATGNNLRSPSPFLHASGSLRKTLRIFGERRSLYSHWLVRFPKTKDCIDFGDGAQRRKWFSDAGGDSSLLAVYVRRCRSYTEKDSELVYLRCPDLADVEWWDEATKTWQDCLASAKSQWWMTFLGGGGNQICCNTFSQSGPASSEAAHPSWQEQPVLHIPPKPLKAVPQLPKLKMEDGKPGETQQLAAREKPGRARRCQEEPGGH